MTECHGGDPHAAVLARYPGDLEPCCHAVGAVQLPTLDLGCRCGAGPLATIPGAVPPPWSRIDGCAFAARCPLADDRCRTQEPPMRALDPDHAVACWRAPIEAVAS